MAQIEQVASASTGTSTSTSTTNTSTSTTNPPSYQEDVFQSLWDESKYFFIYLAFLSVY